MSEKKLRIAIVGLGFGAEFIPIFQKHPRAELVAICQRNEKTLEQIGEAFGVERRYTDYGELLRDGEVDAVHINTPIPDHWVQHSAPRPDRTLQKNRGPSTRPGPRHITHKHTLKDSPRRTPSGTATGRRSRTTRPR